MNSPAQHFAVCHHCEKRHPVFSEQGWLDFQHKHLGHSCSLVDRDWLNEQAGAPELAAWQPRKKVLSFFGPAQAFLARTFLSKTATDAHAGVLRAELKTRFPAMARMLDRMTSWQLAEFILAYDPNADVKISYASEQSITCTLASLASSATASRESTAIDNTSNLYLDYLLRFAFKLQTGTPGSDKAIYIFAAGSADGTNYTDNATGSDAALTLRVPTNLKVHAVVACPDSGALTYVADPITVAARWNGVLPRKFNQVINNFTNVTLSATEGDHTKKSSGVYATVA